MWMALPLTGGLSESCPWPSGCRGETAGVESPRLGPGARGSQLVSRGPSAAAPVSSPVSTERHRSAHADRSPTLRYSSQTQA